MSSKLDNHGDRMKYYENLETSKQLMKGLPIYARLDGHGFSKFTKPFKYPHDENLRKVFSEVCEHLIEKYNIRLAFHQSDEISLLFFDGQDEQDVNSDIIFGGKIHKLTSLLAASTTSKFISSALKNIPEHTDHILNNCPAFDCRIFNVPNITEAINEFVWREKDCTKNSVSMLARHYYSHKQLINKSRKEMLDMIIEKGDNWNNWPSAFKRGTYLCKEKYEKSPNVIRTRIIEMDVPPIIKVQNKNQVLLNNITPVMYSEDENS